MKSNPKVTVIGVASALWLVVAIQRLPAGLTTNENIGIDTSWVVGLPAAFTQHYLAGRDFYFMYGPLAQVITWIGARLHTPWSPIDSVPLVLLVFSSTSILLLGLILLLLTELDAKECVFLYAGIAALNLFSEPTSFRVLALIVVAALIYRMLISRSSSEMLAWAAAAGGAAVIGQLITVELGPYALMASILAIAIQTFRKGRLYDLIPCCTTIAATYLLGNLGINTVFMLSSRSYHFFDYQRHSLELMRGYNYTSGVRWDLGNKATAVLIVLALFTLASVIRLVLKSEASVLLTPLTLLSLITMKSAVTRSDIGHITQATSPLIFTFLITGVLFFRGKYTRYTFGSVWVTLFIALVLVWPWSRRLFPVDLVDGMTHSPLVKLAKLRTITNDSKRLLPTGLTLDRADEQRLLLPFPHELYIPVAFHRPLVAPVFQSFLASPPSLQKFYVDRLETLGRDLDVTYGVRDWEFDGVQNISRVPQIFEYLYRHFRLSERSVTGCDFCVLERDTANFELKAVAINFENFRTSRGLEIRPETPAACSLLKFTMQVDYPFSRFIGHVMPLDVMMYRSENLLVKTGIVPIEVNAPFSTYVSLVTPDRFYTILRHSQAPQSSWDKLRIEAQAPDWAGIAPSSIRLQGIDCVTI